MKMSMERELVARERLRSDARHMSNPEAPPAHAFPRTGKRGVPQQFPRRLYEMLEIETEGGDSWHGHPCHPYPLIAWSPSGKAFRIADVHMFAATVLPKYFRTCKFSSFQRNLNLYGFAKVRHGPDADMYAHPEFVQGRADWLFNLRKLSKPSDRKLVGLSSPSSEEAPSSPEKRRGDVGALSAVSESGSESGSDCGRSAVAAETETPKKEQEQEEDEEDGDDHQDHQEHEDRHQDRHQALHPTLRERRLLEGREGGVGGSARIVSPPPPSFSRPHPPPPLPPPPPPHLHHAAAVSRAAAATAILAPPMVSYYPARVVHPPPPPPPHAHPHAHPHIVYHTTAHPHAHPPSLPPPLPPHLPSLPSLPPAHHPHHMTPEERVARGVSLTALVREYELQERAAARAAARVAAEAAYLGVVTPPGLLARRAAVQAQAQAQAAQVAAEEEVRAVAMAAAAQAQVTLAPPLPPVEPPLTASAEFEKDIEAPAGQQTPPRSLSSPSGLKNNLDLLALATTSMSEGGGPLPPVH